MLAAWGMPAGAVFNEGMIRGFLPPPASIQRWSECLPLSTSAMFCFPMTMLALSMSFCGWKRSIKTAYARFHAHSLIFDNMFICRSPFLRSWARRYRLPRTGAAVAHLRKRELAQLNPFDLVVLLSLSNTVQNAIIGDDNSVTGG